MTGAGAEDVPRDESHLVVRAMLAAFDLLGTRPAGLRLTCRNRIPHGRGLGSSSAAIVAGVSLARALVGGGSLLVDDDAAVRPGRRDRGPSRQRRAGVPRRAGDLGAASDGRFFAVPAVVDPRVSAVVFVPPTPLETTVARGLLPATVPHADAAANAGRAALLVAALGGHPEHLLLATRDWLHQDYRAPAMPESADLVRALRADGVPALISGAGPTVLAFCDGPACTPGSAEVLLDRCPAGLGRAPPRGRARGRAGRLIHPGG